jgi:hypothetical protein
MLIALINRAQCDASTDVLLASIYEREHAVFVFLCVAYYKMFPSPIHAAAHGRTLFFFMAR